MSGPLTPFTRTWAALAAAAELQESCGDSPSGPPDAELGFFHDIPGIEVGKALEAVSGVAQAAHEALARETRKHAWKEGKKESIPCQTWDARALCRVVEARGRVKRRDGQRGGARVGRAWRHEHDHVSR